MPNYAELMSDCSSVVSEYQRVYTKELAQAEELERKLQSIYEQSGYSKLHRIIMETGDAFIEYQKQVRYLSKVYDSIRRSGTFLNSEDIPKTTISYSSSSLLKKQIPYVAQEYAIHMATDNVAQNDESNQDSQAFSPTLSNRANDSPTDETAIIPAEIGKWFTTSLLQKIRYDDFAAGETSDSEEYIEEIAETHGWATTMNWLNTVYLDNYSNSEILIGLMHCLSHFGYENVKPAGPTMALGVLQHEDIFVRDYAIRAFENWNDKEAIPILKALSCEAEWLQDYVDKVIISLER